MKGNISVSAARLPAAIKSLRDGPRFLKLGSRRLDPKLSRRLARSGRVGTHASPLLKRRRALRIESRSSRGC